MDPPETQAVAAAPVLGRTSWEEILQAYKLLGPARSFPKVCAYFKKQGRKCYSIESIKKQSTKDNWAVHVHEFDQQVARDADTIRRKDLAQKSAEDMESLAGKMRKVAHNAVKRLAERVSQLKLKTGGEWKAVADAVVALNKAAEVLDGGVSDRTESVKTVEQRKGRALDIVNSAFAQINKSGQDNAKRTAESLDPGAMDHAGDARTGTGGV